MARGLSAEEVLTTTRGVRRRLDVTRPVDRQLLVDSARVAQQAPSGRNRQRWDFLFVTDPARRADLAELWRLGLTHPTGDDDTAPSRQDFDGARTGRPLPAASTTWWSTCTRSRSCSYPASGSGHAPSWRTRSYRPAPGGRSCRRCGASCWPPTIAAWALCGPRSTCTTSGGRPISSASRTTPSCSAP